MKTQLAALEVKYIVDELKQLEGSRVDKVYQPGGFLIQFHTKQGKILLRIEKNLLWITKSKPETPETITGICRMLRNCLEGKKLIKIEQLNGERIIRMEFATQKDTYYLYIELFANGNLIITDKDKILAAVEERAWKDRAIKKGLQYTLPPSKLDITKLQKENFETKEPISKHLAQTGFGKLYANELCQRSGINPETTKLTKEQLDKLFAEYKKLLTDKTGAHVYLDGEIVPVKLEHYKDGKKYPSFSEAIDANFATTAETQKTERKKQSYLAKKERIDNLIALQEKSVKKLEKDAIENQRKGELVYEHYQELKEILEELNKAKAKFSLQEIKAKLQGHSKIKDVNPKTSDVIVEI
ncbi:MAG TPA: NFACT family protein [Candidatus Nanoarchaeia archaeon]|nr:NFACT family protein [Candidatus Nanoarchaeia archaeon]